MENNNPFLNIAPQRQNSINFTDLISGSKKTENTISDIIKPVENTSTIPANTSFVNNDKPKGILEMFNTSQTSGQESGLLKRTLTPTSNSLWLSNANETPSLFTSSSNTQQSTLFSQPPPQSSPFGQIQLFSQNNDSSAGIFGNQNNNSIVEGNGNSVFGNNNAGANSLFGGNMGGSMMGGESSNQNSGMGLFGGSNSGSNAFQSSAFGSNNANNNPFLSQGPFGGNSSSAFGSNNNNMSQGSFNMGSGQKKKGQKERAF